MDDEGLGKPQEKGNKAVCLQLWLDEVAVLRIARHDLSLPSQTWIEVTVLCIAQLEAPSLSLSLSILSLPHSLSLSLPSPSPSPSPSLSSLSSLSPLSLSLINATMIRKSATKHPQSVYIFESAALDNAWEKVRETRSMC